MKRLLFIAAGCVIGLLGQAQSALSEFEGLKSREILEKIRNEFRPPTTVTSEVRNKTVSQYAVTTGGRYRDYFSDQATASFSELTMLSIVPTAWWPNGAQDAATAAADLHNILPANKAVATNRRDYPPGIVSEIAYSNSYWKAGIGEIAGMETNFYEPADEVKGDIARIYMYVAAVYARPLWAGRAAMFFADGYYPVLTTYGRDLLLEWHRADPVDDAELRRNSAIREAQGRGNPFVEDSELAEYVWGKHSDEAYGDKTGNEDDPSAKEPIMLKAVYSVSRDGRIDFRSPYVETGSTWTFNGKNVDCTSMSLEGVAPGRYELTFSNPRSHGKLIITVEP